MTRSRPGRNKTGRSAALLALLGVTGWYGWRIYEQHAWVGANLPAQPVPGAIAADLADRLNQAEAEARSLFQAKAGLMTLSRLYHANGFYPAALSCYETLRQLEPRHARWPHLQASILAGFGRIDEARPLWQQAIALAPDYVPARIHLGDILTKANQTSAATPIYQEALQRDPDNPYALLGLARNRIMQGDWRKAREHLLTASQVHPDFVGALSLLVTVQEHLGATAEARTLRAMIGRKEFSDIPDPWLEELTEYCYDSYRLSVAAAVARMAGNLVAARHHLVRAVALTPTTAAYRRQLGQLLYQNHELVPARGQLEKALAVAPDDVDAWLLLVDIFTDLNLPAEAARALASGLAANPQSAALHFAYGHRLSEAGRYLEAIPELKRAKELRPNEGNAYVELAMVYFGLERIDEGMAELKAAISVQPGNPLALQVLARHAINSNDEPAARHYLQQLRAQARGSDEDLKLIQREYQQHFGRAP